MCSDTVTEISVKSPVKLVYFTQRMEQVTDTLPEAGHRVAASHSHCSARLGPSKLENGAGHHTGQNHYINSKGFPRRHKLSKPAP